MLHVQSAFTKSNYVEMEQAMSEDACVDQSAPASSAEVDGADGVCLR